MFSRIVSGHKSTGNDSIGLITPLFRDYPLRWGLIGWIIASHLCEAVVDQQICKEWRKLRTIIMLECYFSFPLLSVALIRDVPKTHSE